MLLFSARPASPLASAAPLRLYSIVDLGPLPTRAIDQTPGLNELGDIAAWREVADGRFHATQFKQGRLTDLGAMAGYPTTFAADLNASGTVVGLAQAPDDLRQTRAVVWRGGKIHDLGTLGGKYALANAVDRHNQIVGAAQTATGTFHAALWQDNQARDLGTLGEGDFSAAHGISDDGTVVGEANVTVNGSPHAFVWSRKRMQELNGLPGGAFSRAQAINNRQEIVGSGDLPQNGTHAILWQQGRPTDLGTLGDEPSIALGINDHAQIVGMSAIRESVLRAFLWQNGRMVDLNTLLPPKSGWLLLTAYRINNRGEILGRGFYRGETHACLLVPSPRAGQSFRTSSGAI